MHAFLITSCKMKLNDLRITALSPNLILLLKRRPISVVIVLLYMLSFFKLLHSAHPYPSARSIVLRTSFIVLKLSDIIVL